MVAIKTTGSWVKLVTEGQYAQAVEAFTDAVHRSFKTDGLIRVPMTQAEIKRRFDLCALIFEELFVAKKWSLPHIFDRLPVYLRCDLDGTARPEEDGHTWMSGAPPAAE